LRGFCAVDVVDPNDSKMNTEVTPPMMAALALTSIPGFPVFGIRQNAILD
jgi:hypothetical protein